jgi:hypothetical protein
VCAGGCSGHSVESSAEVWGPPKPETVDAAWSWRELPAMSVPRLGCCACVMSDGRFVVLGGTSNSGGATSSCEAMAIGGDAH